MASRKTILIVSLHYMRQMHFETRYCSTVIIRVDVCASQE